MLLLVVLAYGKTIHTQVITTHNLSLEASKKIVAEAIKYAKENKAPGGSVAVVDAGGNLFTWKDWTALLQHRQMWLLKKQILLHSLKHHLLN